jgi:hypothetical protein
MLFLALGVALVVAWMWGRSEVIRRGGWRVGAGLLSVVLVVVGAALSVRGDWPVGLPIALLGLFFAAGGRINRGVYGRAAGPAPPPPREGMSLHEARAILGVGPEASAAEIRAAYTRLMQRAHPDVGGTAGLAAQLNAARDRLLRG